MRIAHVGVELVPAANGAFVGGLVKNVATIGRAQRERGDDVQVFTTDVHGRHEGGTEAPHGVIRTVETAGAYGSFRFGSTFMTRAARALRRTHRETPFDVVHVHSAYAGFAAILYLLPGIGARKVFSLYSPNFRAIPGHDCNGAPNLGGSALSRRSLSGFDSIVVPSQNLRARLLRLGLPPDRIVQVSPALEDRFFDSLPGRAEARRRLGLSEDRSIVGFVGNFSPWKGAEVLLRAIAQLRALGGDEGLLAAWGDPYEWSGNQREAVVSLMERLGLEPAVTQLGIAPDVRLLLRAADVLASPLSCTCKVLDLPLSILEALGCETPVVGTAVGGMPEALDGGERGLVVPAESPGALAVALRALLSDPDRARSMGIAGSRWVKQRNRTATVLAELDAAYGYKMEQGGAMDRVAPNPLEVLGR